MTVSSTTTKNSYSGDSSTTVFAYTFKIFDEDDIAVIVRTDATGVETVKTKTTDYSVSNVGDPNGGNVTFVTAPASGETVVLLRSTAQTQTTDYTPNDPFPAAAHEDALDRVTFIAQEIQEELDRAIKVSKTNTITSPEFTTSAVDRANKIFAFDSNGDLSVAQELGTYRGTDATTTTSAYNERDLVKSTTAGQLDNVYIALQDSPSGTLLTNTSYWALVVDAVSAATSATNAASSASAAATSASNAATSASSASSSASTATTQASNASASATAAAASAAAAALSADTFDDTYLGSKASDPSVDNDGDPLNAGDLYFNTTSNTLKVYNGSAWNDAALASANFLQVTNNLSDVNNAATALSNLSGLSTTGGTLTGDLNFGDNNKAVFGAGSDLQIYHDSSNSHSFIKEAGTGSLYIQGEASIALTNQNLTSFYAVFNNGGSSQLNYAGSQKLATTSTGVTVTGTAVATTNTDTTNTGNVTLDFATNQNFVLTLTGNVTLDNPTTEQVGQSGFIVFIQDATGGRTVSLGTDYETAGGAGLTLSTAASTTDVVPYIVAASGRILLGTPQLAFA